MSARLPRRIGIDLGGTKIEAVAMDQNGSIVERARMPAPKGDYEATLTALVEIADRVNPMGGPMPVGIGIPGSLSPATGLVRNANSTWLIGKPFDKDVSDVLGKPIRIANDADCFALSEASDGAGAGALSVFGVILGTGVGGGLVVGGKLVTGPNAIAGEWGHNPLPWADTRADPALACYCGKHGCIETYLSGPGWARHFARATGWHLASDEIARRAMEQDPGCLNDLGIYHDRLARALAQVINIFDPHVIVLGGGLSKIESLYREVPRLWGRYVFSDTVRTQLRPPQHGDASGVRGAAWLWSADEAAEIAK